MGQSRKWLAALAATGSAVGAGVALSNAPGASATAASTTAVTRGPEQNMQLAAVETEANQLQSMITQLRRQVQAEQTDEQSYAQKAASADSSRIQAEQAQLASEAKQLASEQASLTAERESLASTAAKLEAEQQQLAAEARQLSTPPTTHTTTGASSATTSGDDGGHDN